MSAKMKTLEEQHQDYQRHIAVLKESLCAKEEHYNMLQADVSITLISFRFKKCRAIQLRIIFLLLNFMVYCKIAKSDLKIHLTNMMIVLLRMRKVYLFIMLIML